MNPLKAYGTCTASQGRFCPTKAPAGRASSRIHAAKEGGVIDRPTTIFEKDVRKVPSKQKPRNYKTMLHNDSQNRREYVVRVLLKVVKSLTMDDAVNVMQHAHQYGKGVVITSPQPEAEKYCEGLRSSGLISTVEPDKSG
jgi:ATP-dependent Clp protease adaptor protein ClpS